MSYTYAEEALAYLSGEREPAPDIILLDINMPRMDGFEFIEAVLKQPPHIHKPVVVMLTTSLDPRDEMRASQFDIVKGYLTKPLSQESLRDIIQY